MPGVVQSTQSRHRIVVDRSRAVYIHQYKYNRYYSDNDENVHLPRKSEVKKKKAKQCYKACARKKESKKATKMTGMKRSLSKKIREVDAQIRARAKET